MTNDNKAPRIKAIDELVQINNKVVELLTAITTVGQVGGLTNASIEARVNMMEQTVGGLATAMNAAVNVLKEQEALIDKLGDMVDELTPVDAEEPATEGESALAAKMD